MDSVFDFITLQKIDYDSEMGCRCRVDTSKPARVVYGALP